MLTQPAASCEWQVMGGVTLAASADEVLMTYGADAASWSGDTLFSSLRVTENLVIPWTPPRHARSTFSKAVF